MLAKIHDKNLIGKKQKVIGGFSLEDIPKYISISYVLVACYTYYMGVIVQKKVKPFPHCTITATATPFPQNIAFRFVIIPQLGGLFMVYLAQYFIFRQAEQVAQEQQKKQNNLMQNKGIYQNICSCVCTIKFMIHMATVGIFLIGMAIATIDTEHMNNGLHGGSAVGGFLMLYFTSMIIVHNYKKLKPLNPEIISDKSLRIKQTIVYTFSSVVIYILTHPFFTDGGDFEFSKEETSVIEYLIFLTLCTFFYSYSYDYKNLYVVFNVESFFGSLQMQQQQQQQQLEQQDSINQSGVTIIPLLDDSVMNTTQESQPVQYQQCGYQPQQQQQQQVINNNQEQFQQQKSQYPQFNN